MSVFQSTNFTLLTFFFFYYCAIINNIFTTVVASGIPVDSIAVSCGSSGDSIAKDDRLWVGDAASKSSSFLRLNGKSINSRVPHQAAKIADSAPYVMARLSSHEFAYSFSATPGQKFVRLHFYPAPYNECKGSKDFFTVKAGPYTLLSNFSPSYTADALGMRYFHKEFCINVERNQELEILFSPSQKTNISEDFHAFINGIEIVSMPTGLYYTNDGDLGAHAVGQTYRFFIDNSTAFEMIQRLNVGGNAISSAEDWGMFREWSEDTKYLLGAEGVSVNTNIMIKYIFKEKYIVPEKLYRTARTTTPIKNLDQVNNLTWKVPVDLGFRYLVRLHLCETESGIMGKSVFDVFMNNQVAEVDSDLIKWGGEPGNMVYRDYVVMMKGDKMKGKRDLIINLQPKLGKNSEQAHTALNGLEIFKLSNPDNNLASPNPVFSAHGSTSLKSRDQGLFWLFGSRNAIATGITFMMAFLNIIVYHLVRCHSKPNSGLKNSSSATSKEVCRQFSLAELQLATNNFNHELVIGKGGYGNVYKGHIDKGTTTVAIKRLKLDSRQGANEFWTEIKMLSKVRHDHLVSLIGYCNDVQEMILVYEYMARGTLADHLYKIAETGNSSLSWELRLSICINAARGLHCLHTNQPKVIHRDVKSSNILLDENWQAKISDFGLSKMGPASESCTHVSTMVKGSFGYFDPEYFLTKRLTIKSDVYAFGVVLFEVLCGRAAVDTRLEDEQHSLAQWACRCIEEGKVDNIIDARLMGKILPVCLKAYVAIAMKCLRKHPQERPLMDEIISGLVFALALQYNRVLPTEQVPQEEIFGTKYAQHDQIETIPKLPSTKEDSTNEVQGRNNHKNLKPKLKDSGSSSARSWRKWWRDPFRQTAKSLSKASGPKVQQQQSTCLFSLEEIRTATKNFDDNHIIGFGGFDNVYKGHIDGGQQAVMIRKFYGPYVEHASKIETLCSLRNVHVVSFIGHSPSQESEMVMVYEYMANGTLHDHLHNPCKDSIPWNKRLQICIDAVRGLHYLHNCTSFHQTILHRDLKSTNILLDENWVAKVLDFCLSKKKGPKDRGSVSQNKWAYLDSDYVRDKWTVEMSYVYSFGVIMFEVLCATKGPSRWLDEDQISLADWMKSCLLNNSLVFLIDSDLMAHISPDCLRTYVEIASGCLHDQAGKRPSLRDLVANLESALEQQEAAENKGAIH